MTEIEIVVEGKTRKQSVFIDTCSTLHELRNVIEEDELEMPKIYKFLTSKGSLIMLKQEQKYRVHQIGESIVIIDILKEEQGNKNPLRILSENNKMSQQPQRRDPLSRHLYRLKELADQNNIPDEMQKEIERCLELVPAKEDYCDLITTPASEKLEQLEKDTRAHPWEKLHEDGMTNWKISPGMMSGNLEVQLIKSMISMSRARRVLELGCFSGYGALGMAEALPADGIVITCEFDPYLQKLARKFVDRSPHGKKVTIKPGPAKDTMLHLAEKGEKFDLIFMDANKDGYEEYYSIIFEKELLVPNGTIVVDNALGGGYTYSKEQSNPNNKMGIHIEKFNQMTLKDSNIHRVLLPLKDGMMLIRRKVDVDGQV